MSRFVKAIALPLLCISVVCVSLVEGFYYWFDQHVEKMRLPAEVKTVQTAAGSSIRGSRSKDISGEGGYSVIIERNLFSSSAESDNNAPVSDPLEGVEASSLDVVLMGTISGSDDAVRAIIYDKSEKKQELYQVGDYIQQAVIKQILRGKVIINYNNRDEMLDISEARNVAVPRVASVRPVVVKQRITGRPIGRPSAGGPGSVDSPGSQEGSGETTNRNIRKPLRSFSGGIKVDNGSDAEIPADNTGESVTQ